MKSLTRVMGAWRRLDVCTEVEDKKRFPDLTPVRLGNGAGDGEVVRVERADDIGDKGAAGLHKSLMRVGR